MLGCYILVPRTTVSIILCCFYDRPWFQPNTGEFQSTSILSARYVQISTFDDIRCSVQVHFMSFMQSLLTPNLVYFRQRRDRFHRRRNQQRVNGHIEDIPQVYRPLIGCDDIDGLTKKMNGVLIHKVITEHSISTF